MEPHLIVDQPIYVDQFVTHVTVVHPRVVDHTRKPMIAGVILNRVDQCHQGVGIHLSIHFIRHRTGIQFVTIEDQRILIRMVDRRWAIMDSLFLTIEARHQWEAVLDMIIHHRVILHPDQVAILRRRHQVVIYTESRIIEA